MFKKFKIFLRISLFQTWWEKQTFWVFQCSFLRETLLWLNWKVLYEFLQKYFKTTERDSFAVCGSLCGEKKFLLIFILFSWFVQKQLFKQIQIFLRICLSKYVEKNQLAEYFNARFCDSHFFVKRKVLYEFPPKCLKTKERHSLTVCRSISGEKQFLVIFIPIYWFDQKKLFKQIQNFLRICPFQTW